MMDAAAEVEENLFVVSDAKVLLYMFDWLVRYFGNSNALCIINYHLPLQYV